MYIPSACKYKTTISANIPQIRRLPSGETLNLCPQRPSHLCGANPHFPGSVVTIDHSVYTSPFVNNTPNNAIVPYNDNRALICLERTQDTRCRLTNSKSWVTMKIFVPDNLGNSRNLPSCCHKWLFQTARLTSGYTMGLIHKSADGVRQSESRF